MSAADNGGPAFATACENYTINYSSTGMTLRDYFAAKAMQGLIAQSLGTALDANSRSMEIGAQFSYRMADAMLKARSI